MRQPALVIKIYLDETGHVAEHTMSRELNGHQRKLIRNRLKSEAASVCKDLATMAANGGRMPIPVDEFAEEYE